MIGRMCALQSLAGVVSALLLATASIPAMAQGGYPTRTIKIVVPVPPGGFADTFPRLIAEKLSAKWRLPIIVENRPGAGLNVAAEAVAKSEPDAYTLLATPPGPLATNRFIYSGLGYDPDAFVPVTILASGPLVLVVRSSLPVSSLQELIAYAKANPDKLNFASSGVGSPPHLAMEMLKAKTGIRVVHVPYKGLTPALTDVVAGHVDIMFHDPASTLPQIRAGRLKALGNGGASRISELPEVPAIAETVEGFSATTWYAIVAPPKTPQAIASKLSMAIADVLRLSEVARQMTDYSITPVGSTPAQTADFLKAETERWRAVIVAAGIKPGQK